MQVDYVDHMGSDLTVVNAARVSFAKHVEEFSEGDTKLINYLANHNHWTPFAHPTVTLRIKAPIFVARQLYKHKVGFTENEVSRRYVDEAPEFFIPDTWRGRPVYSKQGSSDVVVDTITLRNDVEQWDCATDNAYHLLLDTAVNVYDAMIKAGVAPEQARMVLPQSMYTEWYWTASLAAYARMCKQRLDPHAQQETRDVAELISGIIEPLFPVSWRVLIGTE